MRPKVNGRNIVLVMVAKVEIVISTAAVVVVAEAAVEAEEATVAAEAVVAATVSINLHSNCQTKVTNSIRIY